MNRTGSNQGFDESSGRPAHRAVVHLRRLAIVLMIAILGLVVGVLVTPTLRRAYYERRLTDADPVVRFEAMNMLAGMSVGDDRVADPLVEALLRESRTSATVSALPTIAGWAIERSTAVRQRFVGVLAVADDDRFVVVADWLRQAGYWRQPTVELEQLVRREHLRAELPAGRVLAIANLAEHGPPAGVLIAPMLDEYREDSSAEVRAGVVAAAAACLAASEAVERYALPALEDGALSNQRLAVRVLGVLDRAALSERVVSGQLALDWRSNGDLVWALAGTSAGVQLAEESLREGHPEGDQRAAWLLGFGGGDSTSVPAKLVGLLGSDDPVVLQRAAVGLVRSGTDLDRADSVIALLGHSDSSVRAAAAYALGRVGTPGEAVAALRAELEQALQAGDVLVAKACVESLGVRGDEAYRQVLLDVVEEFPEQAMLALEAARAAAMLDRAAALEVMLELCACPVDEVREMAAFTLAGFGELPDEALREGVARGGDPFRGGAALALALGERCNWTGGERLAEVLSGRFDPRARQFEPAWAVRSNYLSARLACGDTAAEADLEVYLLNDNVSPVGPMTAMLHAGRIQPLDMLLLPDQPSIDVDSLLFGVRFAEVLRRYMPEMPLPVWVEDEAARALGLDQLRSWWGVQRLRLRFDEGARVFRLE